MLPWLKLPDLHQSCLLHWSLLCCARVQCGWRDVFGWLKRRRDWRSIRKSLTVAWTWDRSRVCCLFARASQPYSPCCLCSKSEPFVIASHAGCALVVPYSNADPRRCFLVRTQHLIAPSNSPTRTEIDSFGVTIKNPHCRVLSLRPLFITRLHFHNPKDEGWIMCKMSRFCIHVQKSNSRRNCRLRLMYRAQTLITSRDNYSWIVTNHEGSVDERARRSRREETCKATQREKFLKQFNKTWYLDKEKSWSKGEGDKATKAFDRTAAAQKYYRRRNQSSDWSWCNSL